MNIGCSTGELLMIYVFDTSAFIVISHYYPERFPTFWDRFEKYTNDGKIYSVREVFNELNTQASKPHLAEWIKKHKSIFLIPGQDEMNFTSEIFKIPHFQYLVSKKQQLKGTPVADPFVIASAKMKSACIITEESKKENASRIPNICEHFNIECTNVEGFMEKEDWEF